VKMSKMQARQTSVVYSVTVPGGNSLESGTTAFIAQLHQFQLGFDIANLGVKQVLEIEQLMVQ